MDLKVGSECVLKLVLILSKLSTFETCVVGKCSKGNFVLEFIRTMRWFWLIVQNDFLSSMLLIHPLQIKPFTGIFSLYSFPLSTGDATPNVVVAYRQ